MSILSIWCQNTQVFGCLLIWVGVTSKSVLKCVHKCKCWLFTFWLKLAICEWIKVLLKIFISEIKSFNLWYVKAVVSWGYWLEGIEFLISFQIEREWCILTWKVLPALYNTIVLQTISLKTEYSFSLTNQITTYCLNWIPKTLVAISEFIK